jgi:hypothetical protein
MAVRDNKFARQSENLTKRNLGRDETVSIDARLALLEEDVRRLKIEFDVFFNGGNKRAPYDSKNRVETMIKRIADERSLTFAQRYYYNSIVARYTSFREMWRRTMQGREEGRGAVAAMRSMQNPAEKKEPELKQFVCRDVERDAETTRKIYDALIQAKQQCDKPVDDLSFPSFQKQLAAQINRFRQNNSCEQIRFEIGVDDDRVVFKARAAKNE